MQILMALLIIGAVVGLIGFVVLRGRKGAVGLGSDSTEGAEMPPVQRLRSRSQADVSPAFPPEAAAPSPSTAPSSLGKARKQPTALPGHRNPAIEAFLADAQKQAKDSDDRRKATFRAHVERDVPPISDDGRHAIKRAQQAHVAIKHVFPPRLPQRSMSYLGGLPIVPDEFDWPTVHNREGLLERLNFMAQIDCSGLPPGPARDLLPDKGYLYFFAPLSDSFGPDAMHFVARYEPKKATQKWAPLDMPFSAKVEPSDALEKVAFGARTHFDRVEVEFGWIAEPSDAEVDARADEGHAHEVAAKIRAEKFDAFFGPSVAPHPSLSAHLAPTDSLWTPYPGFPANWHSARLLRRFVEAYHREETTDVAERLKALGEVAQDAPEAQRLRKLQTELSAFGIKMGNVFFPTIDARIKDYDSPPDEVKQNILSFLDNLRVNGMPSSKERTYGHRRLPSVLNDWIAFAAVRGAEIGLTDPAGAASIAPETLTALTHRHSARKHQMFGLGDVVQVAADDMKDRYLLLLQLGPDAALNWTIGEMGPLQYWITPEDLAAKRFENTLLTIEAY
jgi:uncharacterized protein YwqG